jgi:hypothetical protein
MKVIRAHNGELVALVLAAGCAWLIAATVLRPQPGSPDALHLPGLAAAAAVASTWLLWRLIAAYGRRLVLLRAAIAGGLAGVLALPVFMFLVILRDAIAACAGSACVTATVLSLDGLGMAAAGSAVFSVMGLVIVGPLTVPVGMLGGILAVVLSGTRRDRADTPLPATSETSVEHAGPSSGATGA